MEPSEPSGGSSVKSGPKSYRPAEYWKRVLADIFKSSLGDAERSEKAKNFAQLLRDESTINFATITSEAFDLDKRITTKHVEFLIQNQTIEAILTRLEPSKIRDAEPADEDAAAFAIFALWSIIQMPAERDGLENDKWRDPRYKAWVERIFRVPHFFSRVLDCLTADCYHTSRTAAWIACFVIKVLRLGAKAAIWRDVVPLIANALKLYDVQKISNELNDRPLLSLLYYSSPKDLTPGVVDYSNSFGLNNAFVSLSVALYPAIIAEDHECLFAALTPQLIDCVRTYIKHPSMGSTYEATMAVVNPLGFLADLLVKPRKICRTQDEMYERRIAKVFEYWPTMADDLAAICDKICRIDYIVKMMNDKNEFVEEAMEFSTAMVRSCLDIFWTLASMDKYLIKLKDHAKLFARMIDAGYATKLKYPKTPVAGERLGRIFHGGWEREMDSDLPFDDFGPGVTCAVVRPYQRQALLNCLARLTIQFSESRAAVGSAAEVWSRYVAFIPQEAEYAKTTGNSYFQQKDYWSAVICYKMSSELSQIILGYYQFVQPPQQEIDEMKLLACIAHSNAAQSYIELKQWRAAFREAEFVDTDFRPLFGCALMFLTHSIYQFRLALYYIPNHGKSIARREIARSAMNEIVKSKLPDGDLPDGFSMEFEELGFTANLTAVTSEAQLSDLGIELPQSQPQVQDHPSQVQKKRRRRRRRRGAAAATSAGSQSSPAAEGTRGDDMDDEEDGMECIVCFEPQETPLGTHPCGHGPLCSACYKQGNIKSCPICRQKIQKLVANPKSGFKFFFSEKK